MFIAIAISLISIALIMLSARIRHNTELRDSLHFNDDISPRLRISVIMPRVRSVHHIASMLLSESTAYQLIVVFDFSQNQPLLHEIIHYFGLFKAHVSPNNEIPTGSVRALLRSHRRLFAKVIVVDSPASNLYSACEVGAAISSFNYNLQIDSPRALRPKAIDNLLFELSSRDLGEVEEIRSAIGEHVRLVCREAALPSRGGRIRINRKKRIRIAYRLLQ